MAPNGDVTQGGTPAGNIHTKPGLAPAQALYEYNIAYLMIIWCDDNGATWHRTSSRTTAGSTTGRP